MTSPLVSCTHDMALPLYTVAQLRAIEEAATQALPPFTLMARAGEAAAFLLQHQLAGIAPEKRYIWLAAGPGNNGGDALSTATILHQHGMTVKVCMPVEVKTDDARHALQIARAAGVSIVTALPDDDELANYRWVVDGLFGIGLTQPLTGVFAQLVKQIAKWKQRGGSVLALDVPSGLNSDTGQVIPHSVAIKATYTITFIGAKPGLYTACGRDYAGAIAIAPLELEAGRAAASPPFTTSNIWLNAPELFTRHLPERPHLAHKGTFGSLTVVGGADGMCGAPILAARAALLAGAGKVAVALLSDHPFPYDPLYPELMLHRFTPREVADKPNEVHARTTSDALVIGCGLGQSKQAQTALEDSINTTSTLLIDADGLNLIAKRPYLAALVAQRSSTTVITPHPLEAARLLACDVQTIQDNRLDAARELTKKFSAITVLKGSGTLIASPDGRVAVNQSGHVALATGGTGDVLSGLIGALLAQRMQPFAAALTAVFLHGRAAESLVSTADGPSGLTASEIAPRFRRLFNQLARTYDEN